jgi:hypothetical protein
LDYVGEGDLWTKPNHKDGSSFCKLTHKGTWSERVAVTTLDDLWLNQITAEASKRILLWIDCEGSELQALRGGTEFLKRVHVINIEMTGRPPTTEPEKWSDPVEVHQYLKESGFYRLHIHTHRTNDGQCDSIYVRKELFDPHYCCCPCEIIRWRS